MQEGDRLIDAINAAGGYLPDADSRMLNHAMKLSDEFVVYVPVEGEEVPEGETSLLHRDPLQHQDDGTVNINTSDEVTAYDDSRYRTCKSCGHYCSIEMNMVYLVHGRTYEDIGNRTKNL